MANLAHNPRGGPNANRRIAWQIWLTSLGVALGQTLGLRDTSGSQSYGVTLGHTLGLKGLRDKSDTKSEGLPLAIPKMLCRI